MAQRWISGTGVRNAKRHQPLPLWLSRDCCQVARSGCQHVGGDRQNNCEERHIVAEHNLRSR